MAERLRLAYVEAKKKVVRFVQGHTVTVPLSAAQQETLALVRRKIQEGKELPPFCYRVNRDSTPDDLLEREGVMHLHLSPDERGATVFLIQYEEHVVFLSVTSHAAFKDDPPGSYLCKLHRNAVAKEEAKIDAEAAEKVAAKSTKVQAGLLPRSKPKPASVVPQPSKPRPGRPSRRPEPGDG